MAVMQRKGKDEINPGFLQRSETCVKQKIMTQQY
jgi:hypothetical protein